MNEKQARTAANVLMAGAAAGIAFAVVRNPRLRKLAWQSARQYTAGPLAAWMAGTVRQAWDDSRSARSLPSSYGRQGGLN